MCWRLWKPRAVVSTVLSRTVWWNTGILDVVTRHSLSQWRFYLMCLRRAMKPSAIFLLLLLFYCSCWRGKKFVTHPDLKFKKDIYSDTSLWCLLSCERLTCVSHLSPSTFRENQPLLFSVVLLPEEFKLAFKWMCIGVTYRLVVLSRCVFTAQSLFFFFTCFEPIWAPFGPSALCDVSFA